MSRSERLLQLLALLRRHRYPVAGRELAQMLDISLRTLYRDIASLQAQGAEIEGEAGLGYILKPGFMLPPLMFSEDEIEALVLGMRWVSGRTDVVLSKAAQSALSKISAILPDDLRRKSENNYLIIGPTRLPVKETALADLRKAIQREHKIQIDYIDNQGQESQRVIWPFGVSFFDQAHIVMAFCELRQDFRHFRLDRIKAHVMLGLRYPKRAHLLFQEWQKTLELDEGDLSPATN